MTIAPNAPQPGIVVSTAIVAGDCDRLSMNHAEGIVVSTAIVAGDSNRMSLNHAEGLVA